jgi:hypothetical protein
LNINSNIQINLTLTKVFHSLAIFAILNK